MSGDMGCRDCLEKLDPYLDRELDPAEFEEVRIHLQKCGGCEEAVVVERVFLDQLRGAATSAVAPPGVRERLILRIRRDVGRAT
ncbi:MAG: zf-HC2 domain-containing protein [Chloroflexota bacterium]|nr:zf-HC2 domain-containing protein [Chloroflexota bacterium]MDE3192452.1 zf-HC2 domain-containing protein [Chloroflexota bacterium]